MIQSIESFAAYFDSIRRRTLNYVSAIPPEQVDWKPRDGEFSCGDILRHLTEAESMFTGVFATGVWKYSKPAHAANDTLEALITQLEQGHSQVMEAIRAIPDSELLQPRPTLDGPPIKAWRLLMMLVEHEIHHRSQLAMYLMQIGVQPPHIYGMGLEDVIARATS